MAIDSTVAVYEAVVKKELAASVDVTCSARVSEAAAAAASPSTAMTKESSTYPRGSRESPS